MLANSRHPADNFVAWHNGIRGSLPLVAGRMQIGMTDATIENLDLHIPRARLTTLKGERLERGGRAAGGKPAGLETSASFGGCWCLRLLSCAHAMLLCWTGWLLGWLGETYTPMAEFPGGP
jgi:hypothetical protein